MSVGESGPKPRQDHRTGSDRTGSPAPRLVVTSRHAPSAPPGPVVPDEVEQLADLLLRAPDSACLNFVQRLQDGGLPFEGVLVHLLAPATRLVGEAWTEDRVGFLEASIAYGRVQQLLRRLAQEAGPASGEAIRVGRVLVSVPEGEQHTLGLFTVAEVLLRDGWEVVVGRPVLEAPPATLVHGEWFDAVLFSAAHERHVAGLKREIAQVRRRSRNPGLVVVIGGHLAAALPDAWCDVGADAPGCDADATSALLQRLLAAVP